MEPDETWKDEWSQHHIIHCPEKKCKGMLLQNPYKHYMKCSDCNKFFMEIVSYTEINIEEFKHQSMKPDNYC